MRFSIIFIILLAIPITYAECIIPTDDLYINCDTTLCQDTYLINDTFDDGVIIINASNIILDCNNSILKSDSASGYALKLDGFNNVTIRNCNFNDYYYGSQIYNSNNTAFINNKINTTSTAFYMWMAENPKIINNTFLASTENVFILSTINNMVLNDTYIDGPRSELYMEYVENSSINRLDDGPIPGPIPSPGPPDYGWILMYSNNNIFNDILIANHNGGSGYSGGEGYGLSMDSCNNNIFNNLTISDICGGDATSINPLSNGGSAYGLYVFSSDNNKFYNTSITNINGGLARTGLVGNSFGVVLDTTNNNMMIDTKIYNVTTQAIFTNYVNNTTFNNLEINLTNLVIFANGYEPDNSNIYIENLITDYNFNGLYNIQDYVNLTINKSTHIYSNNSNFSAFMGGTDEYSTLTLIDPNINPKIVYGYGGNVHIYHTTVIDAYNKKNAIPITGVNITINSVETNVALLPYIFYNSSGNITYNHTITGEKYGCDYYIESGYIAQQTIHHPIYLNCDDKTSCSGGDICNITASAGAGLSLFILYVATSLPGLMIGLIIIGMVGAIGVAISIAITENNME